MTTLGSQYGSIRYATETTFGEDVDTVSNRIPIIGRVDLSGLTHPMIDPGTTKQYFNDGSQRILGTMGGSFTTEFMLTGAGASTSGAVPTVTEFITLLGAVIGNTAASASSGTTLTGGTATVPTTTASGTFSAGSMCRVGAAQDGDGEGQFYAIATHVTTTLTLLNGLWGAPVNGAVMYTGRMVYPYETVSTGTPITGLKFQLHTANYQALCHGCWPTSVSLSGLGPSQQPKMSITWGLSWFEFKASTFPVTTTTDTTPGMSVAGGSLFMNDVGTATSALVTGMRDFEFNLSLNCVPLMGTGGVNNYHAIVAAKRLGLSAQVVITEDAEAATTTPTRFTHQQTDDNTRTNKHICYSLNTRNGGSFGIYCPNMRLADNPVITEMDGINVVKTTWDCLRGTTTTNDLTLSAFRFCHA